MYEVEIKIELSKKEKEDLVAEFEVRNFEFRGITPQNDFYIEMKKSPHGGHDLKRYRSEAEKYIYTEKIWEMSGDTRARKENEHAVSKKEFDSKLLQFPDAFKIVKDREWYAGSFQDRKISLTIDSVKFNHSPDIRYFLEAEIVVENSSDVARTKDLIWDFLKELLRKPEITEAPGMFTMAFGKK